MARSQASTQLNPPVARVDVIVGDVRGPLVDRHAYTTATTTVAARLPAASSSRVGDVHEIVTMLPSVTRNIYVRVRGTNTTDLEPGMGTLGANPWADLWFHSNPIFISVTASETQSGAVRSGTKNEERSTKN